MILRSGGFELTNGTSVIATIPKAGGEYDLAALSKLAQSLKREHPDVDDASILLEPRVEYDDLIQVMDAIRSAEKPAVGGVATVAAVSTGVDESRPERVALFTAVAAGAKQISRLAVSCLRPAPDSPAAERMPCGACRQVIAEFMLPESEIIVDGAGSWCVAELLPEAFRLANPPFFVQNSTT